MWKGEQSKDLGILGCGFWPRVCHSLAVGLWANSSSVKLGVYTGRAWEVSPSIMLCDLFHSLQLLKFCWQETEPDKKWEFFQKLQPESSGSALGPKAGCMQRAGTPPPPTAHSLPCGTSFLENATPALTSFLHA